MHCELSADALKLESWGNIVFVQSLVSKIFINHNIRDLSCCTFIFDGFCEQTLHRKVAF